jgi:hypothetical protein
VAAQAKISRFCDPRLRLEAAAGGEALCGPDEMDYQGLASRWPRHDRAAGDQA